MPQLRDHASPSGSGGGWLRRAAIRASNEGGVPRHESRRVLWMGSSSRATNTFVALLKRFSRDSSREPDLRDLFTSSTSAKADSSDSGPGGGDSSFVPVTK